jgi:hypothetical protein
MIEQQSNFDRNFELANLPAGDPARRKFEAEIVSMPSEQRALWLGVLRETDELRDQLNQVKLPIAFEQRLLHIPRDLELEYQPRKSLPSRWSVWNANWMPLFLRQPANWLHVAAGILFLIGFSAYQLWPADWKSHPLNDRLAHQIARSAVQIHKAQPKLEVVSSDVVRLQSVLASHKLPFEVVVFQPLPKLDLRGGGVCDFDGAPAVYSRWQGAGVTYTVYQFAGPKLGVPDLFFPTTSKPRETWDSTHHYRVVIWRGDENKSTWAVVMENDEVPDVFSMVY